MPRLEDCKMPRVIRWVLTKQIIFYLDTNIVILDGLDDSEISTKVLRAIDKQIEELGWNKSAEVNE